MNLRQCSYCSKAFSQIIKPLKVRCGHSICIMCITNVKECKECQYSFTQRSVDYEIDNFILEFNQIANKKKSDYVKKHAQLKTLKSLFDYFSRIIQEISNNLSGECASKLGEFHDYFQTFVENESFKKYSYINQGLKNEYKLIKQQINLIGKKDIDLNISTIRSNTECSILTSDYEDIRHYLAEVISAKLKQKLRHKFNYQYLTEGLEIEVEYQSQSRNENLSIYQDEEMNNESNTYKIENTATDFSQEISNESTLSKVSIEGNNLYNSKSNSNSASCLESYRSGEVDYSMRSVGRDIKSFYSIEELKVQPIEN